MLRTGAQSSGAREERLAVVNEVMAHVRSQQPAGGSGRPASAAQERPIAPAVLGETQGKLLEIMDSSTSEQDLEGLIQVPSVKSVNVVSCPGLPISISLPVAACQHGMAAQQ